MKIIEVRTHRVTLPVRPEFAIVSSAGGHPVSRYVFIEIGTDDGTSGWGETTVVPPCHIGSDSRRYLLDVAIKVGATTLYRTPAL